MTWIDEMFVNMEKESAAASAMRTAEAAKAGRTVHPKKQIPGAPEAWTALISAIANDVNDFNQHKERAGQTAVRMSQRRFQCEVYVPGMHGKRMVLTLDGNDLRVSVHPDFPEQRLSITIEPGQEGQHSSWVLGEPANENGKLSVQRLSEYLLKPVLAYADIQ